jgi:hypothetical protein
MKTVRVGAAVVGGLLDLLADRLRTKLLGSIGGLWISNRLGVGGRLLWL